MFVKVVPPKECNASIIIKMPIQSRRICLCQDFPLVAYSTDTESCPDKRFLGVALSIHPRSMLIAQVTVFPDGETMYISPFNLLLLLVNHVESYSSDMTTTDKTECNISCRDLNRISEKSISPLDKKLQCSVYGPDRIQIINLTVVCFLHSKVYTVSNLLSWLPFRFPTQSLDKLVDVVSLLSYVIFIE